MKLDETKKAMSRGLCGFIAVKRQWRNRYREHDWMIWLDIGVISSNLVLRASVIHQSFNVTSPLSHQSQQKISGQQWRTKACSVSALTENYLALKPNTLMLICNCNFMLLQWWVDTVSLTLFRTIANTCRLVPSLVTFMASNNIFQRE